MEEQSQPDLDPRQKPLHGLEEEPRSRYPLVWVWGPTALMLLSLAFLAGGWSRTALALAGVALVLFLVTLKKRRSGRRP